MYSIDSENTFNDMERLIKRIKKIREGERIPIMMVGNKSDLEDDRMVSQQEANEKAKRLQVKNIETSAKTNRNIENCIEQVLTMALKYLGKLGGKQAGKSSDNNDDTGVCDCLFNICSLV